MKFYLIIIIFINIIIGIVCSANFSDEPEESKMVFAACKDTLEILLLSNPTQELSAFCPPGC
jgi:hypothetical protein